jgi:hypothetical protein
MSEIQFCNQYLDRGLTSRWLHISLLQCTLPVEATATSAHNRMATIATPHSSARLNLPAEAILTPPARFHTTKILSDGKNVIY